MKLHSCLALVAPWLLLANLGISGCGSEEFTGPAGAATCQIGEINCDGTCVLLDSSPLHCGTCANACPAPVGGAATCTQGECGMACSGAMQLCSDECVDMAVNLSHCGGCGQACAVPDHGVPTCLSGACGVTCEQGYQACGETCADLSSAAQHCGACDQACGPDEVCAGGTCVVACPVGQTRCGDGCADTLVDPLHCGSCDGECETPTGGHATCVAGICGFACDAPLEACGGTCADTNSDPAHCGGCDVRCEAIQGTAECQTGTCVLTCDPGFADCDAVPSNGCESNLATDLQHCGSCVQACNDGELCSGGACGLVCSAPTVECSPDGCVDTATDALHCGSCATACPEPITGDGTGAASCAGSTCGVTCSADTATLCDTGAGLGCVDAAKDPRACGGCENGCGPGERCEAGACKADSCAWGMVSCGVTGCANLATDPSHCGSCSGSCAGGNKRCEDGACKGACAAELTACGGLLSGYACVDTKTNPAHCGTCDNECDAGQLCTGGACEDFLRATGCWACALEPEFPVCCATGNTVLCLPEGKTCP